MRRFRAEALGARKGCASSAATPAILGRLLLSLGLLRPEKKEERIMKPFQSKKAIWWAVGVGLVIAGIFAYAVILPSASEPYGADAPDIHVPSMRNAPAQPGTHKLDLEVQSDEEATDSGK